VSFDRVVASSGTIPAGTSLEAIAHALSTRPARHDSSCFVVTMHIGHVDARPAGLDRALLVLQYLLRTRMRALSANPPNGVFFNLFDDK
jgi:hypothetical protein